MAITYDAPSNTITVTGYSESVPCTFEDVYQADQAGGWGVVSKQSTTQYAFDAKIQFGDGSTETWFADKNKQITFNDGVMTARNEQWMRYESYAYITFGVLEDASLKSSSQGIDFISLNSDDMHHIFYGTGANAHAYVYSSSFMSTSKPSYVTIHGGKAYNVILKKNCYFLARSNTDHFNVIVQKAGYGISYPTGTWDRVLITDCSYALFMRYSSTLRNLYARGCTKFMKTSNFKYGDFWLINPDLDTWEIDWSPDSTNKVYRQYTFNLKVTEQDGTAINGATVTLKDKDDNQVFSVSTAADGTITEQTVTRGYYDQAHGDTLQDYSPHKLIIEKAGFQTYEIQGITMEKIDWTIKLAKAVGVFLSFGSPVINLKKTDPENKNVIVL